MIGNGKKLVSFWNSTIQPQRSAKEIAMCSDHVIEKSQAKSFLQHG